MAGGGHTYPPAGLPREGEVAGVVEMWQSQSLAGLPRQLPELERGGAALAGVTTRAPLFASGVPELQAGLLESARPGAAGGVGPVGQAVLTRAAGVPMR